MGKNAFSLVFLFCIFCVCGCGCKKEFPNEPLKTLPQGHLFYDTNGDRQADFFLFANKSGRFNKIGYDRNTDGECDEIINLDELSFENCRHLVIILDGFGYSVVKEFYDGGGLRMFYPPSKVIAPYPTLTDICMEDVFGYISCPAFQARYFDRYSNKVKGGKGEYLEGANQPYNVLLDYRANLIWDAIGYVYPKPVFEKELNDLKKKFDDAQTIEFLSYIVSSAGISTKYSKQGQLEALKKVDKLVKQVLRETSGQTKITLMADHGHSYTQGELADFNSFLKKRGWKQAKKIEGEKCFVSVPFGILTCNYFWTNNPRQLAEDLSSMKGVQLASYIDYDKVVVLGNNERAVINKKNDRYGYFALKGDLLRLKDILSKLKPDEDGYYDSRELLLATVNHEFPAPLQRLWRSHFALVHHCPDVILSLSDGTLSGQTFFAIFAEVASTHGSLNRSNSTTFIMSTAGKLDDFMLTRDIPAEMTKLTGREFPVRK